MAAAVLIWIPRLRSFWGPLLRPVRLLALTFIYVIGIHMIGAPFPRYIIPFLPIIYLLGLSVPWALLKWRMGLRGNNVGPVLPTEQ